MRITVFSLLLLAAGCAKQGPVSSPVAEPAPAVQPPAVPPVPRKADESRLPRLIEAYLAFQAAKVEPPNERFWVWINDQPANPWNSRGRKGMTWRVLDVKGDLCRVGSDEDTDPYLGDTSVNEKLPILCIRRTQLPAPDGVDANNFYAGWSGGFLRLTAPVAGTSMESLVAVNRQIEAEFGKGWGMAEFHDTSLGGWSWWAYWRRPADWDR